jgi:sugar lactone lactonase YvrE
MHRLMVFFYLVAVATALETVLQAEPPDRDITQPGSLIISEASGNLWALDLENNTVALIHDQGPCCPFDIQYRRPFELVVANLAGSVQLFNLLTHQLTTLATGPDVGSPIGVTVVPGDGYYLTDHFGPPRVVRYDPKTETVEEVALIPGGTIDGIAHEASGTLIVTSHDGVVRRVFPRTGQSEIVTVIPGYTLNGIAITPRGTAIIASHEPGAVFEVNLRTGAYELLAGEGPLRDPEDVAIDNRGNIYILDSSFEHGGPDFVPGIYLLRAGSSEVEALYTGAPFGDIVDLLLTPFDGHR